MSSNTLSQNPIFSPTQISGCQLWLDGADPNGTGNVPANGTSLASWVDKSGAGRTATQSTSGYQPILQTNVLAGKSCVYFDGTSVLDLVSYSTNTIPAISMFFVGRQTVFGGSFISITGSTGIYARASGGTYRYDYGGSLYVYTPNPTNSDTTSFHIQTLLLPNNAVGNYYFDGTAGDNTNGFTFDSSSFQSPNPSLGAYGRTSGNDAMTGYIAEVIFYHATLTLAQSQQVEGYLAWKWNLVGSLPSNHPYKNTPIYTTTSLPPSFRNIGAVPLAPSSSPFSFFNPNTITGVQLWLDAADRRTLTLSGSNITQWGDKSSNAFTVSSNGSDPPGTVLGTQFNNLPVVSFPSNSQMNVTMAIPNSSSRSLFYVVRASSAGSSFVMPLGSLSTNGNESYFVPNATSTSFNALDMQGSQTTCSFTYTGGSTQDTVFMLGAVAGTAGTINGNTQSITSSAANFATGSVTYTISRSLYTRTWELGEMILFNVNLGTSQRQQVEGYLAWKWGLVSNLPSNHPFKNVPPGLPVPSIPPRLTMNTRVFSPLSFAGCSVWMDAADSSTLTLSATSISQWRDKAASRVYSGSSTYALVNSYPSVQFNGSQTMTTTTNLNFSEVCTNAANFTCFLVLLVSSTTTGNASPFNIGISGSRFMPFYNPNGSGFFDGGTQADPRLGYSFTNNTLQIHVFNRNTGVNLLFRLNGSLTSSFTFTNPASFANQTYTGYMSPSGAFITGNLCESVYYNNDIGTANIQTIEGYLAWKWGLVGSLPANHPWKRWPPPPS
jgi:hypothetical protein